MVWSIVSFDFFFFLENLNIVYIWFGVMVNSVLVHLLILIKYCYLACLNIYCRISFRIVQSVVGNNILHSKCLFITIIIINQSINVCMCARCLELNILHSKVPEPAWFSEQWRDSDGVWVSLTQFSTPPNTRRVIKTTKSEPRGWASSAKCALSIHESQ